MKIAIIGAGMAGLACADALRANGHTIFLYDKGRGAGGRMSSRRMDTPLGQVTLDHGAQYFTARDPGFKKWVSIWQDNGIAAPWPLAGAGAWVGVPAMNAIIKAMAAPHEVAWGCHVSDISRVNNAWRLLVAAGDIGPFDAAILAIPAEQAASLLSLHDFALARIALTARSQPCWTSMFVFEQSLGAVPSVIRNAGVIAWAARNNSKPGRAATEAWVVQANPDWSQANFERDPAHVADALLSALADAHNSNIPLPVAAVSHRWSYALSAGTGDGALWNQDIALGVCGDWLLGPRVECAWLSGQMMAKRVMQRVADPLVTVGAGPA